MRILLSTVLLGATAIAAAGDVRLHGKPIPAGESTPISTAVADYEAHAGTPRRFSGRITEVCQKEGCWMMLEDGGQAARVMFADHAFTISRDTTGSAMVHGVLSRKALSPEAAKHLAEDGGKASAPAASSEYRIVADGIEISG